MPKKTKKHKLNAKKRRKPLVLRTPLSQEKKTVSTDQQDSTTSKTGEILPTLKKSTSMFSNLEQSTDTFKQDLSKSLIITVVLIVIQFGLFISAQNHYFDISSVIRF